MPALCVYLFGALDLIWDEQVLPRPPTLKSQSLLAYLAMHRARPQSRSRLAGLLWGDRLERRARASLSTSLWHIRRCLPDEEFIVGDLHSVQLNPDVDVWLDTEEFEARAAKDDASELESATALYRGDFLETFFDDWIIEERHRLATEYCETLARLMLKQEGGGLYREALNTAMRLLERDSLREDAHCLAMRAYCSLGQRAGALDQYRHCRDVLLEELGAEPVAETRDFYQAILEGRAKIGRTRPAGAMRTGTTRPTIGTGDPLDVATVSPLVGREDELVDLDRHWRRAMAGQGGLLLVRGEVGVGKTRLLREFSGRLSSGAGQVLWGRCYEFERLLPYQPIVEALQGCRAYLNAPDVPYWVRREVGRLLPESGEHHGRLSERGQQEKEKALLFEGVATFLSSLAGERPCLLVVEDLHWASESTLQMLHYLVRHVAGEPVMLVGSYRPEGMELVHSLKVMERRLGREGLANQLALRQLGPEAIEDLLVTMSGAGNAVLPLARRLYEDTGGNPFFLMETIKALFGSGALRLQHGAWRGDFHRISEGEIPLAATVSQAIQAQSARLMPHVQKALRLASVMGQEFDFDLLNAVLGQGEEATLEALDDLLRHRLIEEESAAVGRDYAFTHHKIREVIYAGIPTRRRQHAHARVGAALEALSGAKAELLAGELAHHYEQGRHVDGALAEKAIQYLLLAGDQSRLAYAHDEAVAHYQQALVLLKEKEDWSGAGRALMKLGLTYHNAFAFQQARRAYEEGFAMWQRPGEPRHQELPLLPAAPHALRVDWIDPLTLDPTRAWDLYSACVIDQLFSGLVEFCPQMGVTPDVTRGWDVSDGGRRYVFHLRDAVRWTDGTPVTAGDFEYAWKRVLDPASESENAKLLYDIKGARALHRGESLDTDRLGVQALDDHTLVVELEEPCSYFLSVLAHHVSYPLPRHVVQNRGERWVDVGTILTNGPFQLESWERGESLVLVRNPEYHGRVTGNVQRLKLLLAPEWPLKLQMYESDNLDIMNLSGLPSSERERIRQRFAGECMSAPSLGTIYVGFDTSRPPFDDPRARRAFVLAIDREQLAFVDMRGDHFPGTGGFIPPGIPGYSAEIGLPHDPNEARRFLAEMGHPGGCGLDPINLLTFRRLESHGKALVSQWQEILGVEITAEAVEYQDFLVRMASEPPRIFLSGWTADYLDPDNFLRVSPIRRYSGWQDSDFDRLVETARQVNDQRERISLYKEADAILIRESAIVPIAYVRRHLLVKPWIRTLPMSPLEHWFWKDVVIEPH